MYKEGCSTNELNVKMTPAMLAAIFLLFVCGFGGASIYLILHSRILFGVLFLLLTAAVAVGLILEQRNASLRITTSGVFQCDLFQREEHILWENCSSISKDVRSSVTYINITRIVREPGSPADKRKEILIMLPWSRLSKKEKELLLAIIADSKLPEYIKTEFFQSVSA